MKNCDEMVNSLLERREQYTAKQKRKRKTIAWTASSFCCVCLVAVAGIGAWQKNHINTAPPTLTEVSTAADNKENEESNVNITQENTAEQTSSVDAENGLNNAIGMVMIDGITYIQFQVDETLFTADTCLGDASNYSGIYYKNKDISATLYTTKESQNVVLVRLENGTTDVLARIGNLVVNGDTYFSTQIDAVSFIQDEYLGKAGDFEIISVPHRNTIINSEDDVWSVKNDNTKLIIKKSDGSAVIFSVLG